HLGVSEETLKNHGAVSQQTAEEMAAGARDALGADLAISVTGIAGPAGGSPEKPVGLAWIGLASAEGIRAEQYNFEGDRTQNKLLAATAALKLLLDRLGGADG
ncbi:MAG: CinA family protein, partial [Anaerolineales bacterium]